MSGLNDMKAGIEAAAAELAGIIKSTKHTIDEVAQMISKIIINRLKADGKLSPSITAKEKKELSDTLTTEAKKYLEETYGKSPQNFDKKTAAQLGQHAILNGITPLKTKDYDIVPEAKMAAEVLAGETKKVYSKIGLLGQKVDIRNVDEKQDSKHITPGSPRPKGTRS